MILAFLVLSVIVLFHEFGHFLFARLNGIAVLEFSLGFGPRLFSVKSKKFGTRYSVKLFPFGGSCAMLGEEEEDAGELSDEKVVGDSFYGKPPLARIAVIAAGPAFNFLMALAFSIAVVSWAGTDRPVLTGVTEGTAAEAAGLKAGDVITGIGNRRVMVMRDLMLYMTVHGKEDMKITYKRRDPETETWTSFEAFLDSDLFAESNGRYMIGVQFAGYRSETGSVPELIKASAAEVRYTVLSVIDSLKMIVRGEVESEDIAGPVRIVTIIGDTVEQVSPYGAMAVFMNLLNLIIMFSANLGVMNLLPLPALDGGRLVFLFWELLTGKPVNQRIENAVNMTGMALLMALMLFVFFNDLRVMF
ncbi:MAG: site-2 protease family protein [Lachnospiraceae bacterium]|nr:site-2 protease family protein [Lachnospiraceae bacterium]